MCWSLHCFFFFFKQKTAYEMRISDWSSDVCSSDLGQTRRAVLHPRDLRIGIGLARPVRIRQLLALAFAIEPDKVVDRRRVDAALLRHAHQHLAVGLAIVTPHDGTQRGVRLHGRAIDADPLAFHQIVPGDEGQYPAEDLVRSEEHTSALQSL